MKKVIGIIVSLAILAGLGYAGYYLYNTSTGASEALIIEDVGDVETQTVGYARTPDLASGYTSESNEEEKALAIEGYEAGKNLFDLLEETEGSFFFVDISEVGTVEGWPVVLNSKEGLAQSLELTSTNELDSIMTTIGDGVVGFLNQDAEGMKEWDVCKKRKGMFPSGFGNDLRQANLGLIFSFDGESPDKYFSDRDLSIKCEDISAEKMTVFMFDKRFLDVCILYNAKVRTESCNGESYFPPEGETEDMKIMVCAGYGRQTVTNYYCIYFR